MADQQRYLVTARKYRPALFNDVVSQEHVTETLKNAIQLDRLAHAYIFSGPRGVGKTTTARILAKAINCKTPREERVDEAEPCCECESCLAFEDGRSMNVFEMDAASNNKVDDIRELRETVRIPPQGNTKKVYILDEVHMLSKSAFNALLKTLEEPPPHALFIFATTEPHKVLPTILSRCQRFDFRRIPVPEIVERLRAICEAEDIEADEESLMLIARKGDGALRDALSAFDQAISLCGTTITYGDLTQALGVVDQDLFFTLTDHVADRDTAGVLKLVHHVVRSGHDLQEFLAGLTEHLRNLLVARSLGGEALEDVAEATQNRYATEAKRFGEADLLRLLTIAGDAEEDLKNSSQPRLKMEMTLLKMVKMQRAADLDTVIQKVNALQQMVEDGTIPEEWPGDAASGDGSADAASSAPSDASPPETPAPPSSSSPDAASPDAASPSTPSPSSSATEDGPSSTEPSSSASSSQTSEPESAYDVPDSVASSFESDADDASTDEASTGNTSTDDTSTGNTSADDAADVPPPSFAQDAAEDNLSEDSLGASSSEVSSSEAPSSEAPSSKTSSAEPPTAGESTEGDATANEFPVADDVPPPPDDPDAPPFGLDDEADDEADVAEGEETGTPDPPSDDASPGSPSSGSSSSGSSSSDGDASGGGGTEEVGYGDLFGAPALTKKKSSASDAASDASSDETPEDDGDAQASAMQGGDGQAGGTAPQTSVATPPAQQESSWLDTASSHWSDFVGAVMSDKIALGANLTDSEPLDATGDELTIAVPKDIYRQSLRRNTDVLLMHLRDVMDEEVSSLRFVVRETNASETNEDTTSTDSLKSPREQLESLRDKYDALETLFSQFGAEPVW